MYICRNEAKHVSMKFLAVYAEGTKPPGSKQIRSAARSHMGSSQPWKPRMLVRSTICPSVYCTPLYPPCSKICFISVCGIPINLPFLQIKKHWKGLKRSATTWIILPIGRRKASTGRSLSHPQCVSCRDQCERLMAEHSSPFIPRENMVEWWETSL